MATENLAPSWRRADSPPRPRSRKPPVRRADHLRADSLRTTKEPDISYLLSPLESLLPQLGRVSCSSSRARYPHDRRSDPTAPEATGLVIGHDCFLRSPGAGRPRNKRFRTANIPKVEAG